MAKWYQSLFKSKNINVKGNEMNPNYLQQGDTLYFSEAMPKDAVKTKFDGVVQHGEATGHAHRLTGKDYEYFETPKKERYLRILKPTMLRHEEHKEIEIPAGDYRIDIVKEYDHFTEEARRVVD